MIKTGNAEIDSVIAVIAEQRNSALDAVAMLAGKLETQEKLTADLQTQLTEALKPKDSQ